MAKKKKNSTKVVALVLVIVLLIGAGAGLFFYLRANSKEAESVVEISVNPQVQLTLNGADKVINVTYLNDDAEKLLIKTDLIGKNIDEAAQIIVELSTKTGYIDVDTTGTTIHITAYNDNENVVKKIQDKCISSVNKFFDENGIIAGAIADTKEHLKTQAQALGISLQEYALRTQAVTMGLVDDVTELADTTSKEVLDMMQEYYTEYEGIALDALATLKSTLDTLGVDTLRTQIASYEKQLENSTTLNDTEKQLIQSQLNIAKSSLDALQSLIDAAFELAKQATQTLKVTLENNFNNLLETYTAEFNSHKQYFEQHKADIQEQIEAYRATL